MLCILVPVYHPYRWLATFMREGLNRFWPGHPPIFFCGLTAEEAGDLPVLPLRNTALPRAWARFVREAVGELQARGFTQCYLLLEEHLPLAPCHVPHLNHTLPELLTRLDGAYLGLMGWDNRRYATRAPILGPEAFHCMHLSTPQAPRFHLHPSLWRLEALGACLDLTLRDPRPTPWRFEKVNERVDAELPERWKQGCYQICGRELTLDPPGPLGVLAQRLEHFVFHKLMAVYPFLNAEAGRRWWNWVGFDDFFYPGPYPLFFSGVMAKGVLNPCFAKYVTRHPSQQALAQALLAACEAARTGGNSPFSPTPPGT